MPSPCNATCILNNVEVTCTCTNVFTVITTKDQSGGIQIVIAQMARDLWLLVNKPHPRDTPSDKVFLLPYLPGTML